MRCHGAVAGGRRSCTHILAVHPTGGVGSDCSAGSMHQRHIEVVQHAR
jgi:hypothetical protein